MYFQYGDKETEYLKKKDKVFGEIIEKIGHIERELDSDLFPLSYITLSGSRYQQRRRRLSSGV